MFSSTYIVIHADHIWNSSCCTIYGVTKSFWVGPFLYPINRNLKLITKRKAVLVCTMKTHIWGVELHLLLFWTSALCGGKRRSSSSGYFPHGKEHRCPLNRRLGGPQSQPGCFGEEKKKSLSCHEPNRDRLSRKSVEKIQMWLKSGKISGTLNEHLSTFY